MEKNPTTALTTDWQKPGRFALQLLPDGYAECYGSKDCKIMLIGHYFKEKRIEKGLSEAELVIRISPDLQESLLWDFEAGDDTDIDGWSIQDFKKYCEILEIDPTAFADIPVSNMLEISLASLVKARRNEMGYTTSELSDIIGYEESVIKAIEEEQSNVIVVLDVLKQLSLALCIPFRVLLQKI